MSEHNQTIDSLTYDEPTAGDWMTLLPPVIKENFTYHEAAKLISEFELECFPFINHYGEPIGIISFKQLMDVVLAGKGEELVLLDSCQSDFTCIQRSTSILSLNMAEEKQFLVVNEQNQLIGVLTKRDLVDALSKYVHKERQSENTIYALDVILEQAYEGIAVVDENGILMEFNEAYSRFVGIKREDAIGRHVTEVIENTHLHITVKTGIPDRGVLQTIQGQPMVVHRIPIWKEERIVGAIGMLIFEGVSEVYDIYDRLQTVNVKKHQQPKQMAKKIAEDSRISMAHIIGSSESILSVKRLARKAARTLATVFISGESGTGKEIFAKSIHHLSPAYNGPFISVNCGAIPEQLFESELFGYETGAFTGAHKDGKPGKFELADHGTLFLDEIGELSLVLQTKLLRVLQEREVERVGGVRKYKVNVRVIAATNRDIEQMVEEGTFREDLYYRLNIIRLHLPPLRERKEDIPILLAHFLKKVCEEYGIPEKHFTANAVATLTKCRWKGNIRELVNTVEHAAIMTDQEIIDVEHLPQVIERQTVEDKRIDTASVLEQIKSTQEEGEKQLIVQMLDKASGNKTKAAKLLGIHRTTLYQKLKKYDIR